MSLDTSPLVDFDNTGSVLSMHPSVSEISAVLDAIKQVDTSSWALRMKNEFEKFTSVVASTLTETYLGDWDQQIEGLKVLVGAFSVDLERWRNKTERDKYATTLKAETLSLLLINEAGKLERPHYRVNQAFQSCAFLLNGNTPKDKRVLSEFEQKLVAETRERLIDLCVGPDFRYTSFAKWFMPGEAETLYRFGRKTHHDLDLMFSAHVEQISKWTETSACESRNYLL